LCARTISSIYIEDYFDTNNELFTETWSTMGLCWNLGQHGQPTVFSTNQICVRRLVSSGFLVDKPICFDLLRHCACAFDMDIPPLRIPRMICSDCYVLNWISLMIGVFILEPVEISSMEHGEEHSELLCHYYIKGGFATSRTLLHTLGW
jgi:hypothetical protein